MKVGDTVWIFDDSYRVYRRDANNRPYGGPIYREHFRPREIVGETSRSWVLDDGRKVNKKKLGNAIYVDQEAVDHACWVWEHKWRIAEKVSHLYDYDTLKAIADIVGHQ